MGSQETHTKQETTQFLKTKSIFKLKKKPKQKHTNPNPQAVHIPKVTVETCCRATKVFQAAQFCQIPVLICLFQ